MTIEEFKMAFDKAMSYDFEFLESMPEHEFSVRFKRKMRKIIRRADRKSGIFSITASKKFLAMAASFLIVCICTMQVDAISEPIIKFINTVYDKFNLITFDDHSNINYITYEYELTFIPNNFSLTKYNKATDILYAEYMNNSGDIINFSQKLIKNDSHIHLDNEHGSTKTLIISDMEVLLYTSDFGMIAFWVQDNYNMKLSWTGEYNEAEFIRMIESVRAVEPDASAATPDMTTAE